MLAVSTFSSFSPTQFTFYPLNSLCSSSLQERAVLVGLLWRMAQSIAGSTSMVVKRQKSDANMDSSALVAGANGASSGALIPGSRATGLPAPVMELTGHEDEVFAARFDSTGAQFASGSMDRKILMWRTSSCENYGQLSGHKGAVLDLGWSRDSRAVFSASADMTVASWDLETGLRIRRHEGHTEIVNALDVGRRGEEMLVSGSDDGSIAIWDTRMKHAAAWIESSGEPMPITSVAFAEQGNEIYSGGIDNDIKVWDIRKKAMNYKMSGHQDTVTSLQVSPDGQSLLSYSHDGTARTWDIRPFAASDRHLKTFDGAQAGIDRNLLRASWDAQGQRIAAASGDRTAVIWDVHSGRLLFKLPGHKGSVNDARFSPNGDPVILTASTDRTIMLGELTR